MVKGDPGQGPRAGLDSGRSYVLRLWKAAPDKPWQSELHNVATGETHRFTDLEAVVAFLRGDDEGRAVDDRQSGCGGQ